MKSILELIANVYASVGTTETLVSARWPTATVLEHMNDEWMFLQSRLKEIAEELFIVKSSVALTKDTAYTLPVNCERVLSIRMVDSFGNSKPLKRLVASGSELEMSEAGWERIGRRTIYLRNEDSGTYELRTIQKMGLMHYGTLASATGATVTLPSAATKGTIFTTDDYYNGMMLYVSSGTGSGQYSDVSDYVGSTKVITLTDTPSTTPDGTSVYNVLPPIPEQSFRLLELGAIRRCPIAGLRQFADESEYVMLLNEFETWANSLDAETNDIRSLGDMIADDPYADIE